MILDKIPGAPNWAILLVGGCYVFEVLFLLALLNFKKFGFYGFCGAELIAEISMMFTIAPSRDNNVHIYILTALIMTVLQIGIVYGILLIGKDKKAWNQLD